MRREVKQHGNVRIIAFKLPPGNGSRAAAAAAKANGRASAVNCQMQDSPPMAGADDRALDKPSNHSKHPGKFKKPKCRECHQAATASKSRDKGKGALKLRSSDVLLNHRLASWRVVDKAAAASLRQGFKGASASEILRQLSASRHSQDSGDDEQKADDRSMELLCGYGAFGGSSVGEPVEYGYYDDYDAEENVEYGYVEYYGVSDDMMAECFEAKLEEAIGPSSADYGNDVDDDDDVDMDYFMVGMTWEYSDGEDWIVVQEM